MKIGIDVTAIFYEGTGVGRYTEKLVKELLRQNPDDEYVLFASLFRGYFKFRKRIVVLFGMYKNWRLVVIPLPPLFWSFVWNKLSFIKIEKLIGEVDLFHCWDYLIAPSNKPRVVTIHDVTPVLFPESHTKKIKKNFHDVIARIKTEKIFVLTDSENTKKDLVKHLKISDTQIQAVYLGGSFEQEAKREIERKKDAGNRYLLCVGTREPRKNLKTVIVAFNKVVNKIPDLKLLIAGKFGWGKEDLQLEKNVKILGLVEDSVLIDLYKNAVCLLYPSFYEGFGLPVLDAMSLGCPVVTSSVSSLPEIGGEAVVYVNPKSVEEIANAILRITGNEDLRNHYIKKGLEQAKKFSWQKCAKETRERYEKIINKE